MKKRTSMNISIIAALRLPLSWFSVALWLALPDSSLSGRGGNRKKLFKKLCDMNEIICIMSTRNKITLN